MRAGSASMRVSREFEEIWICLLDVLTGVHLTEGGFRPGVGFAQGKGV